ncbi:MAG: phospholipase D-like domain-containing protein, partial [Elusimicrobiota bacterium]
MRKTLLALVLAAQALTLSAAELQFVESVPEETVYGSTMAARPQTVWLEMIGAASKTLDIEQFYIADQAGEVLEPALEAVKAAVKRGVKARFIVDRAMLKESGKSLPALKEAGVETRVIDFKRAGGGVQHAKFFIVDGAVVYTGSQNFDWRSLKHIHELGLRIKSAKAASDFSRIFEADWALAGGAGPKKMFSKKGKVEITAARPEKAAINGGEVSYSLAYSPVNFVPKGADTEITELLKILNAAKKTIRGQVMTYSLAEHGSRR